MTKADVYRFVLQCKLGVLSSIGSLGTPQSALVGIAVSENLEIVFDTVKSSRKYANLIANPGCSFVFGWTGEQLSNMKALQKNLEGPDSGIIRKSIFRLGQSVSPTSVGLKLCSS